MNLADIRREYVDTPLNSDILPDSPHELFQRWLDIAKKAKVDLPNAMVLATSDAEGQPTTRQVLLKGYEEGALFFYTDYGSNKARALEVNSKVALNFFWAPLDRQVSIVGTAKPCSRERSEAYFASRPRGSQLSALISAQSTPIASRAELEARYSEAEERYEGTEIPCKSDWGGYRVEPSEFIFWQGRPGRLHDRFRYFLREAGHWTRERLSP